MSTIKSFDEALDFHPGSHSASLFSRLGQTIRTFLLAMSDGISAARSYHELTHRGVSHDAAVHHVLRTHFRD